MSARFPSDWNHETRPLAPYILRLTHSARGDGIGTPDTLWLVGPFASIFDRANYITRNNPEELPGWIAVTLAVSNGSVLVRVVRPEAA